MECKAQFPADGEWLEGHEKVFINGEPLLLRRCSIMCSYGGCVTILLSGQPE
ncbi:MAG: PAAR-like protein [Waltera sp.]